MTRGGGPPRDPNDDSLRQRVLGVAFWAAMAFGLTCILAGVAIDRYGPKLFPGRPAPAATAVARPIPRP